MAKKKKSSSAPAQAEPLNYGALMASASEAAAAAARAQVQAQIEAYPQLEALQLGTIQKISGNLNNEYTQRAREGLGRAISDAASVRGVGQTLLKKSGPTQIERELRRQAMADLVLGRSLSAEEVRDAQQSARAAFSARGLGTSMGSAAAEILNRDAAAQARESARRNFAAATNNMVTGNVFSRFGQATNTLGSAGQMDSGIAGQQIAVDPYQRALGRANIGAGISGNLTNAFANTWGNAQQMAGNVASYNNNLIDSRYNSYMNNQSALQAARMQSGAMNRAATMGMLGSAIQGGIQAGGMIGAAQFAPAMFSDKRMKKDIKPLGKAGSVLGLTAYEYKYKGDDKKRVGFMAQDVKRVLPEAVTEVEYKGTKRLAIKPAVIGAALAEELMAAKAA